MFVDEFWKSLELKAIAKARPKTLAVLDKSTAAGKAEAKAAAKAVKRAKDKQRDRERKAVRKTHGIRPRGPTDPIIYSSGKMIEGSMNNFISSLARHNRGVTGPNKKVFNHG